MATVGEHGRGGITLRADGRLQVSLTMSNGRRAYATIPKMRDTKRQRQLAEEALRRLVAAREGDLDPSGQLLGEYLRSWLSSMTEAVHPRIRPNTLAFYRIIAEKHLIPVLGEIRLERLRERHVQSWLDGLEMSPRYVSHCRAFLRRVLNVAARQRIIERNPAIGVELPPAPEFRGAPLTTDEARALLSSAAGDRLEALWRLAIYTGLRSGELLGLGWEDVDLEPGRVRVTAQLARRDGQWIRTPTKAARTLEAVALDPDTTAVLVAHQRRQASERTPDWPYWGLVFVNHHGYPLHRREITEAFRQACDRAGIARRRFHDLRMSTATLMAEAGVAEDVRLARLGHASVTMGRHYAVVRETRDRAAVEALAALLR